MSKLSEMLRAEQLPLRNLYNIPTQLEYLSAKSDIKELERGYAYQIELSLHFEKRVMCRGPREFEGIKRDMRKAIVEDVFGEFKKPLIAAIIALHDGDTDKAIDVLRELEKQMFDC